MVQRKGFVHGSVEVGDELFDFAAQGFMPAAQMALG
jgi:hypothetical protein